MSSHNEIILSLYRQCISIAIFAQPFNRNRCLGSLFHKYEYFISLWYSRFFEDLFVNSDNFMSQDALSTWVFKVIWKLPGANFDRNDFSRLKLIILHCTLSLQAKKFTYNSLNWTHLVPYDMELNYFYAIRPKSRFPFLKWVKINNKTENNTNMEPMFTRVMIHTF